jgi:hypothetical protein
MRRTNAPTNTCPHLACLTYHAHVSHRCTHSSLNASTTGIYRASGRLLPNPTSWGTLFARTFGPARCVSPFKGEVFEGPTDTLSTANPFICQPHIFLRHHWALGKYGVRCTIATNRNRYTSSEWWFMDYEDQTSASWHGYDRNANGREPCHRWQSALRGVKMSDGLADAI